MAMTPEDCKGMRIFTGMDYEKVEKILTFTEEKSFGASKIIFTQDDASDGKFYLVVSGMVMIFKNTRKGEEAVCTLEKGDLFGEMAVFNDRPRAATAKTVKDVTCLVLTQEQYHRMQTEAPQVALKLVENILQASFERFRAVASKAETASFWL